MSHAFDRIRETTIADVPTSHSDWCVSCIDMQTGGEPLRVIVSGGPRLDAGPVLGCRRQMMEGHDHVRRRLMWEPRGHADMYGAILLPPERPDSDFGVLFIHNEGYSTMCGHATIALAKLAVLLGWVEHDGRRATVTIDAPCGPLQAHVTLNDGRITSVSFVNVPSFVVALDQTITLPDGRVVAYDLAYGGAFYAYVDADDLDLSLTPEYTTTLIRDGRAIKSAVAEATTLSHPHEPDLGFLYGTIFIGTSDVVGIHSRNVCVFADGEVDRSPTGSGVSGRAAIHAARGELDTQTPITIESIIGSTMGVEIIDRCRYGPYDAVVPRVSGDAWITGTSTFMLDPDDPFPSGFLLR